MSDITPEALVTLDETIIRDGLLKRWPDGVRIMPDSGVVPVVKAKRITTVAELLEVTRKSKVYPFPVGGQMIEIEIRPLTDEEMAEIEVPEKTLKPPQKFKIEHGRQVPDGYNFEDATFLAESDRILAEKRAAIIAASTGLDIPGENLAAKRAYLEKNFPTNILHAMVRTARSMCIDVINHADFS